MIMSRNGVNSRTTGSNDKNRFYLISLSQRRKKVLLYFIHIQVYNRVCLIDVFSRRKLFNYTFFVIR